MRIGFSGTQRGTTLQQFSLLVEVLNELEELTEAHHGDCHGADFEFSTIVDCIFGFGKIYVHPPKDMKKRSFARSDVMYKPKDYLDRNKDIVDATDVLIACPKEQEEVLRSGTWATIRYARKQGNPVVILWSDGKYTYED